MMNATQRLLATLSKGEELTARQIQTRFGVANPRDLVYRLRREGHVIFLDQTKNSRGETRARYSLGPPTRKMVATAVRALGAEFLGMTRRI